MNILSLHDVRKSYGDKTVLDGVTVGIDAGAKIGFVGVNGSGKTTLFRILVGEEAPDTGTVARHRELTVGYLPQEPRIDPGQTVWEYVAGGMAELLDARRAAEQVSAEMAEKARDEAACAALLERYEELQAEVERLGGWQTDHVVKQTLMNLGVEGIAQEKVDHLSGGQRRRAALARVLLMRPKLLVLDEPTNHLDADTVHWLEGELSATDAAVVLITHDRYFLDKVVTRMVELEGGVARSYAGNYSEFLVQKAERLVLLQRTESRRAKLVEQELAWLNRTPAARRGKQKARAKRAETLAGSKTEMYDATVSLKFEAQEKLRGDTILNAVGLELGYDDKTLVKDFTLRMVRGDKLGIIGPNGCGKSTLIKGMLGLVEPRSGIIELGRTTKIGYFDQERAGIDPDSTLLKAVCPNGEYVRIGNRKTHVRTYLQEFLFPWSEQSRLVKTLSGGERNRLMFARLMADGANLLVLDEPTNDLDLDTLQVLEDALARFGGCLLVVTHDRYLLNRVTNHILAFVGDGEVRNYAGDYDIYRRLRAQEREKETAEARAATADDRKARREERRPARRKVGLTRKEERELETLEGEVARLEELKEKAEALMADPTRLAGDPEKFQRLTQRYGELETALDAKFERWTELMERKEEAEG